MWQDLDRTWQTCFSLAWESFQNGSIPIGAVVTNPAGDVLARGRSRQYETAGEPGQIVHHKLSHAELNALLQVSRFDHPDIETYTLSTTMEPCPLCFGAFAMSGVRTVRYAARDRYAGSTNLNHLSPYLASKGLVVEGPYPELQDVQLVLQAVFEYQRGPSVALLSAWTLDSPRAVATARDLNHDKTVQRWATEGADASTVYVGLSDRLRGRPPR